jgi:predicted Zn-dependent protease
MKVSRFAVVALIAALGMLLQACAPEVTPEESCNFVQNSLSQRVSWGAKIPVKMYIHESVQDPTHIEAIEAAARSWNEVVGRQVIVIESSFVSGDINSKKDGRSFIYLHSTWDEHRTTEQARTTIYWNGNRINEADIKINAKNFKYAASETPKSGWVDLQSLMIHEMGHVLGLAHIDHRKSVMATTLPSGNLRRDVSDEDKTNLSCEYPIDAPVTSLAGV